MYLNNLCRGDDVENSEKHKLSNMTEFWFCVPFSNILQKYFELFLAKRMDGFLYLIFSFSLPVEYSINESSQFLLIGKKNGCWGVRGAVNKPAKL